jgi:N-acetylneuraminate synthase
VEPAIIHRAIHRWGAKVIEFHLDLDGKGEEFGAGHCWLPDQIAEVIRDVKKGFVADGNGVKEPVPSESSDRLWRADPSDGLRPMKEIRSTFSV